MEHEGAQGSRGIDLVAAIVSLPKEKACFAGMGYFKANVVAPTARIWEMC